MYHTLIKNCLFKFNPLNYHVEIYKLKLLKIYTNICVNMSC